LQPVSDCFLDLSLGAVLVEGSQTLTEYVERYVPARNLFGALFGWDQMHQNTVAARTRILFRIEVHAGERIFENVLRPPRRSRRAAIASIFQELEFKSQNVQQITFVPLHMAPPHTKNVGLSGEGFL
jgi:hypothetical protein